MEVTLLGIMIDANLLQFWKALPPMEVKPSGILMEVKPLQL